MILLGATTALLFGGVAGAVESHPFSVHDMLAMDRISAPQVAPDASRIVFVRRTTDLEANRGRTDLWLVNLDGKGLRRLTSHPDGDWNPRWSRDGKSIWFLSIRSGSAQVWSIAVDGGEAIQVTDLPLDVGTLAVSPAGGHLAVSMEVFPGATPTDTKAKLYGIAAAPVTGSIYDRLFIRHWVT
ncbi:MAG: PD40 domain-containing protein, partial [Planctomycetes bacterium]|nr:PD40 domain-containing protein [Planctomycetota bacterium]